MQTITLKHLHNMIVLQPPISDKVSPLLLMDVREDAAEFASGHIHCSIHVHLPQELLQETSTNYLPYIEKHSFSEEIYANKFKWRKIALAVICCDDANVQQNARVQFLYQQLQMEHKTRQLFVLKDSISNFLKRYPYLLSHLDYKSYESDFPTHVQDTLYVGGYLCANSKDMLVGKLKISHLINCAQECISCFKEELQYMELKLDDALTQDLSVELLDKVTLFIQTCITKKQRILVYCREGRSRSISMVIAYLMRYKHYPLDQAILYMKKNRPLASPNLHFVAQLQAYEKYLQSSSNQ